jgi:DSF synthase
MTRLAPTPAFADAAGRPVIAPQADGAVEFEFSSELRGSYRAAEQALWICSSPRGIPCFSIELLRAMELSSQIVEDHFKRPEQPLRHIVLRSGTPRVFSVGGDLGYFLRLISQRDRGRLAEYARAAVGVIHRNYTAHGLSGVSTIALLEGDALGGGFEQALSCDIIVAEKHIKVAFPEVLFDMFPGMGGLSFLARRTNRRVANELTRDGRMFSAQELLDMGVIDHVVDTGAGEGAVQSLMRRRLHQHQAHVAMDAIDHMLRPITLDELSEVVRLWIDAAMNLSARGQEWMRRLHRQQIAQFGGIGLVPAATAPAVRAA